MGSTCPICFDDLENKVKASPNACDHVFCLPCLEKWSKLGSYCPVDRKRYKKIINLDSDELIQIKPSKRKRTRIVYDFSAICEVCSKDDCPDTLLLCDCCDLGFHCLCLTPPLPTVPAGLWFCPTCVRVEQKLKQKRGITKEIEAEFGFDFYNRKSGLYEAESPSKRLDSSSKGVPGSISGSCSRSISAFEELKYQRNNEQSSDDETIIDGEFAEKKKPEKRASNYKKKVAKDKGVQPSCSLKKGTVSDLFSHSLKTTTCDKRPGLDTDILTVNAKTKTNVQFSVFESIEDVEASQRKYMDFNAFAGMFLSSGANLEKCYHCKDMISYASRKLCKLCKLKYFTSHSQSQSGKLKKRAKVSQPTLSNNFYAFTKSYTQVLNNKKCSSQVLNNKKSSSQRSSASDLQKRMNSLYYELKSVHNKKWKLSASCK